MDPLNNENYDLKIVVTVFIITEYPISRSPYVCQQRIYFRHNKKGLF